MAAKFDAFKAALDALCKEHGVRMYEEWDYDDCQHVYIEEAGERSAAGLDADIECVIPPIPPTPEEVAAAAARQAEWEAGAAKREEAYRKQQAEWRALMEMEQAVRIQSPEYLRLTAIIAAQAEEQRKKQMRVTRVPGDHNDIGERPCRVYCNEVEILGWTVADDFRRVVETPGKVHHGAVRIDLAPPRELPPESERGFKSKGVKLPDDVVITIYSAADGKEILTSSDAELAGKLEGKGTVLTKAKHHIPARQRKAGK